MLHAPQGRHEVQRQDQDDRDAGEPTGDPCADREHATADVEEVVRVSDEVKDALDGILDARAELAADVFVPGAGHEVLDHLRAVLDQVADLLDEDRDDGEDDSREGEDHTGDDDGDGGRARGSFFSMNVTIGSSPRARKIATPM